MDILQNINKFKPEHYVIAVLCFLAMFSPGLLGLVIYFPSEFMEMSSLKLIVLSCAIGIPLAIPHIFGVSCLFAAAGNLSREEKFAAVPVLGTVFGAAAATLASYTLLAVTFFASFSLKIFIVIVIATEFSCFVVWMLLFRKMRLEKRGT